MYFKSIITAGFIIKNMDTPLETLLQQVDTLKIRLQQARPLHNDALNRIESAFETEYTFESNRIEGHTLSLHRIFFTL
jgi:hypothetical protein